MEKILTYIDLAVSQSGKVYCDKFSVKIINKSVLKILELNLKDLKKFIEEMKKGNNKYEIFATPDVMEVLFNE